MASSQAPKIDSFKAAGAMSKGMAVKAGADKEHVAKATAATQLIIGLIQSVPDTAEDLCEVAMPGGGGKGLLGGTVAFGDLLTADSAGKLVTTTTAGDRVIAVAMDAGVAEDLINVNVIVVLI